MLVWIAFEASIFMNYWPVLLGFVEAFAKLKVLCTLHMIWLIRRCFLTVIC